MARAPLPAAAVLTAREIAEMWTDEIGVPAEAIVRMLLLFAVNHDRAQEGLEPLADLAGPNDFLTIPPSPERPIPTELLREFAAANGWPMPTQWDAGGQRRGRGRPSRKDEILRRFRQRSDEGLVNLEGSLKEATNDLREEFPDYKGSTIEDIIRHEFRALQKAR